MQSALLLPPRRTPKLAHVAVLEPRDPSSADDERERAQVRSVASITLRTENPHAPIDFYTLDTAEMLSGVELFSS